MHLLTTHYRGPRFSSRTWLRRETQTTARQGLISAMRKHSRVWEEWKRKYWLHAFLTTKATLMGALWAEIKMKLGCGWGGQHSRKKEQSIENSQVGPCKVWQMQGGCSAEGEGAKEGMSQQHQGLLGYRDLWISPRAREEAAGAHRSEHFASGFRRFTLASWKVGGRVCSMEANAHEKVRRATVTAPSLLSQYWHHTLLTPWCIGTRTFRCWW